MALVFLGSPRMSYVAGTVLWTDGGWNGALTSGPPRSRLGRTCRRMSLVPPTPPYRSKTTEREIPCP